MKQFYSKRLNLAKFVAFLKQTEQLSRGNDLNARIS